MTPSSLTNDPSKTSSAVPKKGQKKVAKQQRSKQTVENILTATAELIQSIGIDQVTTNKISERSGVNIASIYQYFPNKEAIIRALLNTLLEKNSLKIQSLITSLSGSSIEDAARHTIATGIEIYRSSEGLFFVLISHLESADQQAQASPFHEGILHAGKQFLLAQQDAIKVKDVDQALFVISNAVLAVLFRYLSHPPGKMTDDDITEEVVNLITNYLC